MFLIMSFGNTQSPQESMSKDLSPKELKDVKEGKEVLITRGVNKIWPEIIIYKEVRANSDDIKNLFIDYTNAHTYIPSLKSVVIENSVNENTKDVRYWVRLPILLTINYLVRNKYEATPWGHQITWSLLQSPIASSAEGSLKIETLDKNKSIICYRTHIEPATALVKRLKGQAIKEASATVSAIVQKSESLHKE